MAGILLNIGASGLAMQRTLSKFPRAVMVTRGLAQFTPKYEDHVEIIRCRADRADKYKEEIQDTIKKYTNKDWELKDIRLSNDMLYREAYWILHFKREKSSKPTSDKN